MCCIDCHAQSLWSAVVCIAEVLHGHTQQLCSILQTYVCLQIRCTSACSHLACLRVCMLGRKCVAPCSSHSARTLSEFASDCCRLSDQSVMWCSWGTGAAAMCIHARCGEHGLTQRCREIKDVECACAALSGLDEVIRIHSPIRALSCMVQSCAEASHKVQYKDREG